MQDIKPFSFEWQGILLIGRHGTFVALLLDGWYDIQQSRSPHEMFTMFTIQ